MSEPSNSTPHAGLIIREREPVNLESPFDQLDGLLTPTSLFYVRSHFHAPALESNTYRLSVGGAVQPPCVRSLDDLRALPAVTRVATLECAGNSRIFLVPQTEGAQWQLGAVSTAEWTGVPLSVLLDRAGLDPAACEILFVGADRGVPKEKPIPPGEIHYARSLPLARAHEVLLAFQMNGEDLPLDHGFPVRAIVPGFYGMASVKWLNRIVALKRPFLGYFQTSDYAYWDECEGNPVRVPLGALPLKSAIARPRVRERSPAGSVYPVEGAAWGGSTPIATVELSTGEDDRWQPARLLDPDQPGVWRRWRFQWQVPTRPGVYTLRSRAHDAAGNTQPAEHDKRFGNYVIHHILPIDVVVT